MFLPWYGVKKVGGTLPYYPMVGKKLAKKAFASQTFRVATTACVEISIRGDSFVGGNEWIYVFDLAATRLSPILMSPRYCTSPSVYVIAHPEPEESSEGLHDQRDSSLVMPSCYLLLKNYEMDAHRKHIFSGKIHDFL